MTDDSLGLALRLTPTETEIVRGIARHQSLSVLAGQLNMSTFELQCHLASLRQRMKRATPEQPHVSRGQG